MQKISEYYRFIKQIFSRYYQFLAISSIFLLSNNSQISFTLSPKKEGATHQLFTNTNHSKIKLVVSIFFNLSTMEITLSLH